MAIRAAIKRIADRYEAQGYTVIIEPRGKDLPRFAAAFRPDLVATKSDQKVIVEIKRDRSELEQDESISRLAEVTNEQPGWRFDLIILEPESALEEVARSTAEPSLKEIEERLKEAEKLAETNAILSAFLMAWAGLEPAMRYKTQRVKLGRGRPTAPTVLIRMLYADGILSEAEQALLDRLYRVRSEIVHGFRPSELTSQDVRFLADLGRRLVTHKPKRRSG
jgi:hypothetical protein